MSERRLDGESVSSLSVSNTTSAEENLRLCSQEVPADYYDDDEAHISAHTRFLLSDEFKNEPGQKERFVAHLQAHEAQKRKNSAQNAEKKVNVKNLK